MEILTYIVNWKPRKLNLRNKDISKWAESDLKERLQRLSNAVTSGWLEVEKLSSKNLSSELNEKIANLKRPLYIFAAPEYLFRKKSTYWGGETPWDEHFYTLDEKQVYISDLQALSKPRDCGDVLIAAGTFFWAVPRKTAQTLVDDLKQKYNKRIQTKWAAKPPTHATARLEQIEQTNTEYFGFNEALVFYNGGLRKTVAKSTEAGDFEKGPKVRLIPGMGAGTFTLSLDNLKIKVGVSICADFGRVAEYEKTVDLLFLLSHSISAKIVKEGTIRPGGIMIYSDGLEYNQVIKGPSLSEENSKLKEEVWSESSSDESGELVAVRCLITVEPRSP